MKIEELVETLRPLEGWWVNIGVGSRRNVTSQTCKEVFHLVPAQRQDGMGRR